MGNTQKGTTTTCMCPKHSAEAITIEDGGGSLTNSVISVAPSYSKAAEDNNVESGPAYTFEDGATNEGEWLGVKFCDDGFWYEGNPEVEKAKVEQLDQALEKALREVEELKKGIVQSPRRVGPQSKVVRPPSKVQKSKVVGPPSKVPESELW
mmetsp:Transcript_95931/g.184295  ORF Transcript_95931/g.184295 Transcript_95931/m.184295 type:complete len:152 (-) Transcript_95931:34-489(-)